MKQIITIALLLISLIGYSQDTIPVDTVETPYTKYLIVDESGYLDLNMTASLAKNYSLDKKTSRIWPMNPTHRAYNQDSVLMIAVAVTPENQAYVDTSLLIDVTEVMFVDTVLQDVEIAKSNQKSFDWFTKHYERVGDKSKRWIWISDKIDESNAPDEVREKIKVKIQ